MSFRANIKHSLAHLYDKTIGRPRRHLLENSARQIESALSNHLRQVEAITAIYSCLPVRMPLPPMRGWAVSPDFSCELVREIVRTQPRHILELGSGVSTVVAAYALGVSTADGHILSLEHDEKWWHVSNRYVREHRLNDVAEVVHAPLRDVLVGDQHFPWYDYQPAKDSGPFDILVIDGPPGPLHPMARYPALPLLWPLLSSDAVIILDDANRPAEQAIMELWNRDYGPFVIENPPAEKGMIILRRQAIGHRMHS